MNKQYIERAHGRVNLIGEHTDYNGGWVLPTTIKQFTQITLTKNDSEQVIIHSSNDPKKKTGRDFTYRLGSETKTDSWVDYLQGGTKILREEVRKRGEDFSGFSVSIESTVPEGSGLSSSAALEVSFLKAIRSAFNLSVIDTEIARLGQRIENEFVGARVGIMDQMACCLAKAGEALFLDTHTLEYQQVTLPLEKMDVLIINSGISHRLSGDGGYNQRRAQCEEACQILGIKQLRDIRPKELDPSKLSDLLFRRARHVVTENARVFKAVEAIRQHDTKTLGQLFVESHKSMRDDYQVSLPEIDTLVELCLAHPAVYGARLTGGGFGGSIVAITHKGQANEVAAKVVPEYNRLTGETATVLS